ncbi:MAG: phosphatidate cytidylyltransferase [Thermoguttaceae bacterium]|nr:phosphatidate cytidylyltransferase [Thermoguttaceae bacterium]
MPFFLVCVYFLCKEILQLLNAGGVYPRRSTVYIGAFGTILLCWFSCYNSLPILAKFEGAFVAVFQEEQRSTNEAPLADADSREIGQAESALETAKQALAAAERALKAARSRAQNDQEAKSVAVENASQESDAPQEVDISGVSNEREWKTAAFAGVHILLAIAAGVLIAFIGEMMRFKQPGGNMINLTGAVFAIVYIGLLGSFMVMLRIAYGIMSVVSMIVVTKLCDVGAYTVGRLIGRHKMAPSLSPGKTIEGGFGGMLFAVFGAWFSCAVLLPAATGRPSQTTWLGIVIYGIAVGLAGAIGDLAESLIKRDVMRKDSGANVPGFGGFLDIFDSLLIAAPVAFGLWAFHVVQ